jgi:hypothetical protein
MAGEYFLAQFLSEKKLRMRHGFLGVVSSFNGLGIDSNQSSVGLSVN